MINRKLRTALALLLATSAAGSQAYTIAAPHSFVAGKTIADWGVEWWKWALDAPAGSSGLEDTTGALTQLNNDGPVFFMGGGANGFGPATSIDVTVRQGTPVLLRLVNFLDYEPDGLSPGTTLAERQAVATDTVDAYDGAVNLASLSATIDGTAVADLDRHRERFAGTFPLGPVIAGSVLDDGFAPVGTDQGPAAASGFYLMLTGLSVGRHTLSLSGSSDPFDVTTHGVTFGVDGFRVDQTITLNVAAVPEPASWALLVGGFGFVGSGMRRRRALAIAA